MYFATLKRAIQALEEKAFYDLAILFLNVHGYKELSVVDGTGDGGRDVTCSLKDLRIQLSVRKDWEVKLNYESDATKAAGRNHLIYVTNRIISPAEEQIFLSSKHRNKGDIQLVVYDLNKISTTLAQPGVIKAAYSQLGMSINGSVKATEKEISVSTLLLFSKEARDLRENIVQSNITAWLLKNAPAPLDRAIASIAELLPYPAVDTEIPRLISRMRGGGRITGQDTALSLSTSETAIANAAEEEYLQSMSADLAMLQTKYQLSVADAKHLLQLALELTVRDQKIGEGQTANSDALAMFIAEKGLNRKRGSLYEDLSKTATARFDQYGKAIDRIFSTNTFDIYRALGARSKVTMVLDASVAMPMLCGLAFGTVRSKFGTAAHKLRMLCQEHDFDIMVPSFYINEMASHGWKAKEFVSTYDNLPEDAKDALIASSNAYLSHYVRMKDSLTSGGETPPSLEEYLQYFGLVANARLHNVENKISSLLDQFGIKTLRYSKLDLELRKQVANRKSGNESPYIIDHDAMTLSLLLDDSDSGFVFATWDHVLISMVSEIDRIYGDTPARVIDFLSMARGASYECDQSIDLLTSLIHCDEAKASALAKKIEGIESADQAFRLRKFVDEARKRAGPEWEFTDSEAAAFFQKDVQQAGIPT